MAQTRRQRRLKPPHTATLLTAKLLTATLLTATLLTATLLTATLLTATLFRQSSGSEAKKNDSSDYEVESNQRWFLEHMFYRR